MARSPHNLSRICCSRSALCAAGHCSGCSRGVASWQGLRKAVSAVSVPPADLETPQSSRKLMLYCGAPTDQVTRAAVPDWASLTTLASASVKLVAQLHQGVPILKLVDRSELSSCSSEHVLKVSTPKPPGRPSARLLALQVFHLSVHCLVHGSCGEAAWASIIIRMPCYLGLGK